MGEDHATNLLYLVRLGCLGFKIEDLGHVIAGEDVVPAADVLDETKMVE